MAPSALILIGQILPKAGDTRNRFSVSKFIKLVASICHTHCGTVTTALIAIAAQTSQVLAAAAVDPTVEECDTLSTMDFTRTAVENVSAEKISICLEHQLSPLGVSHRPRPGEPRVPSRRRLRLIKKVLAGEL